MEDRRGEHGDVWKQLRGAGGQLREDLDAERRPARLGAVGAVEHLDREVRQHPAVDQRGLLAALAVADGDGVEVERDRARRAHGVGDELLVGLEVQQPVVPRQPQQPAAGDVGRHHDELVALVGLEALVRPPVAAAQVAEGRDAALLQLLVHEVAQVVALVGALTSVQRRGARP